MLTTLLSGILNMNCKAFLNEPVSPFPGCLVLNGGNSILCTLRGQEETNMHSSPRKFTDIFSPQDLLQFVSASPGLLPSRLCTFQRTTACIINTRSAACPTCQPLRCVHNMAVFYTPLLSSALKAVCSQARGNLIVWQ